MKKPGSCQVLVARILQGTVKVNKTTPLKEASTKPYLSRSWELKGDN